jgi:hypothetical protein
MVFKLFLPYTHKTFCTTQNLITTRSVNNKKVRYGKVRADMKNNIKSNINFGVSIKLALLHETETSFMLPTFNI